MQDAVILDMDGTACDISSIVHYVLDGPHKDFHRFHRESVNCPPNHDVIREVVEAYEAGRAVLIVTAREFKYCWETMFWLSHHLPVPYEQLYMRQNRDYRRDGVIKEEILDLIKADGYNVVHAWDDNPAVIEVWERNGIPTTKVKGHWYDNQEVG